jgi:hypothetical protein
MAVDLGVRTSRLTRRCARHHTEHSPTLALRIIGRCRNRSESTAADRVDDLDAVAGVELVLRELAAGNELTVHLDRQTTVAETELLDESGHAETLRNIGGGAVDDDLHELLTPGDAIALLHLMVKWRFLLTRFLI